MIGSGMLPPNPGEFMVTSELDATLEQLRESSDLVIVDGPPLLLAGEALTLSSKVDALLLVTRMNAFPAGPGQGARARARGVADAEAGTRRDVAHRAAQARVLRERRLGRRTRQPGVSGRARRTAGSGLEPVLRADWRQSTSQETVDSRRALSPSAGRSWT